MIDYERALPVREAALAKARSVAAKDGKQASDDFIAWVVSQELRRAGFDLVFRSQENSN